MTQPINTNAIRIGEASTLLGITEDHLRDLCNKDKIPHSTTPGGHRLFDPRELEEIREVGVEEYLLRLNKRQATVPNLDGLYPTITLANGSRAKALRKTLTTVAPFMLVDSGDTTQALWGTPENADNRSATIPPDGHFALMSDAASLVEVTSISLMMDPLVLHPAWSEELRHSALKSYSACFSALLAGQLTIDSVPQIVVIPVDRLRVLSPLGGDETRVLSQMVDLDPGVLPPEARVKLLPASRWGVFLDVPSRKQHDKPRYLTDSKQPGSSFWIWTGLIQIALQRDVPLGSIGVSPSAS